MEKKPYESAVLLAEPYLETPYADLPENLRHVVHAALHSHPEFWDAYGTKERRRQVDEYDLANNPAREIENAAGWWDMNMDASAWWSFESIAPTNAAMLLSRHNPNKENIEDAETHSSDEMGPDDFRLLKNAFEGASNTRKTLQEWLIYARNLHLKTHSWIETWEEWVRQMQGGEGTDKGSSRRAGATGKVLAYGDRTEKDLLRDQIKVIALELYDVAKNQGWGTDKNSIAKALERVCAERGITTRLKKKLTSEYMSRHMLIPWDIPELAEANRQK